MSKFAEPMTRLIDELKKLPGIGSKTAQRLAFHILRSSEDDAEAQAGRSKKSSWLPIRRWRVRPPLRIWRNSYGVKACASRGLRWASRSEATSSTPTKSPCSRQWKGGGRFSSLKNSSVETRRAASPVASDYGRVTETRHAASLPLVLAIRILAAFAHKLVQRFEHRPFVWPILGRL